MSVVLCVCETEYLLDAEDDLEVGLKLVIHLSNRGTDRKTVRCVISIIVKNSDPVAKRKTTSKLIKY